MTLVPSSSHPSSGGGGFTIGSSSLVCEATNVPVFPLDAPTNVPWTQLTASGADLSIDGVDSSIIHFATTGWYGWGFTAEFVGLPVAGNIKGLVTVWNIPVNSAEQAQQAIIAGAGTQFVEATQLPFAVTAPATLQFQVVGSGAVGGDTADLDDGYLCVTRFA